MAGVHYIASTLLGQPQKADDFIAAIKSYPRSGSQKSAAFAWRYELEQKTAREILIPRDYKVRGTVEAWNLFADGIEVEEYIEIPEKCVFKNLDYNLL